MNSARPAGSEAGRSMPRSRQSSKSVAGLRPPSGGSWRSALGSLEKSAGVVLIFAVVELIFGGPGPCFVRRFGSFWQTFAPSSARVPEIQATGDWKMKIFARAGLLALALAASGLASADPA